MQFAPGPFVKVADDAVTVAPGEYDFTDDAQELSGTLNAIYDGMTAFVDDLGLLAADPLADLEGGAIDGIVAALGTADVMASLPAIDGAVTGYGMADTLLNAAVSFAPMQAWVDPPQPFLPPDTAPSLPTPTIPVSGFDPGSYVPTAGAPNPAGPWVQLLNITRVGQTNFVVGDKFQVVALGKPGQDVTITATFNGETLPTSDYGPLDANGGLAINGTMAPENVGAWFESWYFDGAIIASFNFLVLSGNVPT